MVDHAAVIANLEGLQMKEDKLTPEEVTYCSSLRSSTRIKVTKALGYVKSGAYARYPNINLTTCDESAETLVNLDLILGDDATSSGYLEDIDFIRQKLKSDATEQHRRDAQLAHEQAQREAQLAHDQALRETQLTQEKLKLDQEKLKLDQEQLKLDNERQLQLDEQARRESLHQAQLAAAQQAPVAMPATTVIVQQQSTKAELTPFDGSPCTYRQWERLFEATVENKAVYEPEEKFLIFKKLIGEKGSPLIANLEPNVDGLAIAKQRAKEYFDDPTRVREAVFKRVQKLPTITSETNNSTLREFVITLEACLKSLIDAKSGETYINETYYRQMFAKLPDNIKRSYLRANAVVTADSLIKHVRSEIEINIRMNEQSGPKVSTSSKINVNAMSPVAQSTNRPTSRSSSASSNRSEPSPRTCALCDGDHRTIRCTEGTPQSRKSIALDKRLCFRCLKPGHRASSDQCRSNYRCSRCTRTHSLVLCDEPIPSTEVSAPPAPPPVNTAPAATVPQHQQPPSGHTTPKQVVPTARTQVHAHFPMNVDIASLKTGEQLKDPNKLASFYQTVMVHVKSRPVRVLLDGAAGRSLILESLANNLQLPDVAQQVLNIGGVVPGTCVSKRLVAARLHSTLDDYYIDTILSVVPSLGDMQPPAIPAHLRCALSDQGIETTDLQQQPIEVILGLEYFGELFRGRKLTEQLWGHNTAFGWVVYGVQPKNTSTPTSVFAFTIREPEFIEPPNIKPAQTKLEKEPLLKYTDERVQLKSGRYVARLPWIQPVTMGDNKQIALRRLRQPLHSLKKLDLAESYRILLESIFANFTEPVPRKVLGYQWDVCADTISPVIDIDSWLSSEPLTKQDFAVIAGSVYDPLGLVSLPVVKTKPLMRQLWKVKLDWEDALPEEHLDAALQPNHDARYVNNVVINLNVLPDDESAQLIISAGAAGRSNGTSHLLTSKVKLAREKTIPELELDASVMAATLAKHLTSIRPLDQSVALRVNKPKSVVYARNRHVVSKDNDANIAPRGCTMQAILNNQWWWHSPRLSTEPDQLASLLMANSIQRDHFSLEIYVLKPSTAAPNDLVLHNVKCSLDANGALRLHTRLIYGVYLPEDQVYPIILPAECHITLLVIQPQVRAMDRNRPEVKHRSFKTLIPLESILPWPPDPTT